MPLMASYGIASVRVSPFHPIFISGRARRQIPTITKPIIKRPERGYQITVFRILHLLHDGLTAIERLDLALLRDSPQKRVVFGRFVISTALYPPILTIAR
jgi:hypothetical protein